MEIGRIRHPDDGTLIADCWGGDPSAFANAALIVEAVNSHEYLKARVAQLERALRESVGVIRLGETAPMCWCPASDSSRLHTPNCQKRRAFVVEKTDFLTPAPSMGKEGER